MPRTPPAISARPSGPKEVFAHAWVATAPTPALAHGTTAPTARNLDCTAMPRSPVAGSRATIEKVEGRHYGSRDGLCAMLEIISGGPLHSAGAATRSRPAGRPPVRHETWKIGACGLTMAIPRRK